MTRSLVSPLLLLSPLLIAIGCGRGGPPEGATPSGGDDTGGGTEDGGAEGPEVGIVGVRGTATVTTGVGASYSGTEEIFYQDLKGVDHCSISSQVDSVESEVPPCDSCEWSFTLVTSASTTDCPQANAADFDGATFDYGYYDAGKYGLLVYYYPAYGWYFAYDGFGYPVYPSFSAGSFEYEWPQAYTYLY